MTVLYTHNLRKARDLKEMYDLWFEQANRNLEALEKGTKEYEECLSEMKELHEAKIELEALAFNHPAWILQIAFTPSDDDS